MIDPHPMVDIWRGGLMESRHLGHAVICDRQGIVESWGDPSTVILPRSSCKMIQALPLVETGAADAAGLTEAHLAFACASHQGERRHIDMAARWLSGLGLAESNLRCGAHEPRDHTERNRLIRSDTNPCQLHNNCSGKHCGFLTVTKHLNAGPEYVEPDHPLQRAVKATTEDLTDEVSGGYGIDGCSAPNFTTSVGGLARAMAKFACATGSGGARDRAMQRLTRAMVTYPELVAGDGRAGTELMQAMGGKVAIKSGAEGVYVAILPEQGLGMALKITDGAGRGAEAAIAALLVRAGVLEAEHPAARKRLNAIQTNRRGKVTGMIRAAPGFPQCLI